jgi:hypothetical protein
VSWLRLDIPDRSMLTGSVWVTGVRQTSASATHQPSVASRPAIGLSA